MLEALLAVVLLVLGAGLLTAGAEAFAEHITAAASRVGVTVLALGLLLAGAEPEEAVTAMLAAGQGHPALAAGDAVGANLVILTVTVGLAALLTPLPVSRRVMQYAGAASGAGLVAVLLMWNGVLSRAEGTLLLVLYVAGVVWVWRREQEPPVIGEMAELAEEEAGEHSGGHPGAHPGSLPGQRHGEHHGGHPAERSGETESSRPLLLVLLGLLGMVSGGFLAVRGAQGLVEAFGATESVIGLTVLALATSAEMIALVLAAHRRGVTEIALAGAVGSVAYNATVTLGLASWVDPLLLGRGSPVLTVGVVTAVLPLVLVAGRRTGSLPRALGFVLVGAYVVSVGWLFTL